MAEPTGRACTLLVPGGAPLGDSQDQLTLCLLFLHKMHAVPSRHNSGELKTASCHPPEGG